MIRFIRIKDQISDDRDDFAFFNTVNDKFVEIFDSVVFHSINDLRLAFDARASAIRRGEVFDPLPRDFAFFIEMAGVAEVREIDPE